MNKTLELFYNFLEANNALIAWERNYLDQQERCNTNRSRAEYFYRNLVELKYPQSLILNAFTWRRTPELFDYWKNLDTLWFSYVTTHNL